MAAKMTEPYLAELNEQQKEAVVTTDGPLLILAGAGSGKTRVITHRIVHLIHQGVAPNNILAVTFTNKAAKEMRERAVSLLNKFPTTTRATQDTYPTVTTFHSLAVRLLREHHKTLDLPKYFTIYDRSDSVRAIKEAMKKTGHDPKQFEPKKILNAISRAKGDALSRQQFVEGVKSYNDEVTALVWQNYQIILREDGALDFDDLLYSLYKLLRDYPVVLDVIQNRYKYVHIDEYQDTNKVQFAIAKLLAAKNNNLCVVGDIDQNIYSWRGADIKNVLQFEKNFPTAKVILLEENYRSTQNIIAASNDVIKKNRNRIDKNVFTKNAEGELLSLYSAMNGQDEADFIAKTCAELIKDGAAASDIAVLFRTNFQSRVLEEAFLQKEVAYQVLGTKFFERKEVKDVLSYLRLALNKQSTADLARIINEPKRGIGKVTVLKLIEGNLSDINATTAKKIEEFEQIISDIKDKIFTDNISNTLKFIIKRSGIETDLKKNGTEDDLARLENLYELVTLADKFSELDGDIGAVELLENAALQSDQDEIEDKEKRDAVLLMTIHAAKGLEFPYVFITGLEEGLFPHQRLDESIIDHEEERRLFYVALTRASKKVYLTYAHIRTIFGSQRINIPSSFLDDIDTDYIEVLGDNHDTASGFETTIFLD